MNNNTNSQNPVFLTEADFRQAVSALPLISIDICVTDPSHRLLLGLRANAPARGWWFTPGGRIRKNETQEQALQRIAGGELGLSPAAFGQFRGRMQLMGAWDHFYADSAFSPDISTHYVNMPYWLPLSWAELESLDLPLADHDAQHTQWRWMGVSEAAGHEGVHAFARPYAEWLVRRLRSSLQPPVLAVGT